MILKKAIFPKQEYNRDFKQITTNDSRFYEDGKKTYPSVTYVLSYYPKGKNFEDWLKKVGYASDFIAKKAADEGSIVHNLAERYLLNETIDLMDVDGNPKYDLKVWKMFLRFVDFWETSGAELLETEVFLYSDTLSIAGTCDLVCKINDELWVIDLKTSNNMQTTYELQSAVYARCFEECYETKVARVGILWLKSSKRGSKEGKLQGRGWEVYESKRSIDQNLEIYSHVRALFDLENPNLKPISEKWPTSVHKS
jgi:ATP-dependent exoDNAse (exonuclease V) beta subunit